MAGPISVFFDLSLLFVHYVNNSVHLYSAYFTKELSMGGEFKGFSLSTENH